MADLRYVKTGEPFKAPAPVWNSFVDAARANEGRRHNLTVPPKKPPQGFIPCLLVVASGTSGGYYNGVAYLCDLGYDVYALDDTGLTSKLASNLPLNENKNRVPGVSYQPADQGFYYISGGTYILWDANESPSALDCGDVFNGGSTSS